MRNLLIFFLCSIFVLNHAQAKGLPKGLLPSVVKTLMFHQNQSNFLSDEERKIYIEQCFGHGLSACLSRNLPVDFCKNYFYCSCLKASQRFTKEEIAQNIPTEQLIEKMDNISKECLSELPR